MFFALLFPPRNKEIFPLDFPFQRGPPPLSLSFRCLLRPPGSEMRGSRYLLVSGLCASLVFTAEKEKDESEEGRSVNISNF